MRQSNVKIAVVQMTSKLNPHENLKVLENFFSEAKKQNASWIFLPECFYSLGNGLAPTPYYVQKNNEHYQNIQNLAQRYDIFVIGGSAASKNKDTDLKLINRAYQFDNQGNDLGSYDKIHLFSVDLTHQHENLKKEENNQAQKVLNENNNFTAGQSLKLLDLHPWKIGISICFDLRFPEIFRRYFEMGANILSVSAAFTVPTGKAHWHTLLRARAIENQSYVVASAQWGQHNERISTFGHSLVIDPWGNIILDLESGEKIDFCTLDLSLVEQVRLRMNVFPTNFNN
jgi:predicted amidohydrolase